MAVAKLRADWQQTSSLLALTANVNRAKNGKVFKPNDMMPSGLIDKRTENKKPDFYISPVMLAKMLTRGKEVE